MVKSGAATGSLIFVIADLNRDIHNLEQTLGRLTQRHTLLSWKFLAGLPLRAEPADVESRASGRHEFDRAASKAHRHRPHRV